MKALRRIRDPERHMWLWVDALCIDQQDKIDKSRQIPNMPDIYSHAFNVIAWLGEEEGSALEVSRARRLIAMIINLQTLDTMLCADSTDDEILQSWMAFGQLLRSPWSSRRWVIQEIACARQLSIRVHDQNISWLDFTDAVDVYWHNLDRLQDLLQRSALSQHNIHLLEGAEWSRTRALLDLSRSCFRKDPDLRIRSKLMSLEALVLATALFAVSETRDTIYALLYLANDRDLVVRGSSSQLNSTASFSSDCFRHTVDIFSDLSLTA